MSHTHTLVLTFVALMSSTTTTTGQTAAEPTMPIEAPTPPRAERRPHDLEAHGHVRSDDYYWLNDREDPEVIAYLEAENAYKNSVLADQRDLTERLFDEIVARIKPDDETVPYMDNGYLYSQRYAEGQEHPIYLRRPGGTDGEEEVMLDVNALAEPYDYYAVATREVSPDNRLLVYAEDTLSRRIYTLRFKDLVTGQTLDDRIENTAGNVVWAADNAHVFYTRKDATLRPDRVFRHRIGTDPAEDVEVYREVDPTFYTYLYKTKSREFVVVLSAATLTSEARVISADNPLGEFAVFEPRDREAKLEYFPDHAGATWYVRTNHDAVNFKVVRTPQDLTGKEHWVDVTPARDTVLVEGIEVFRDYLAVSERIGGIVRQRILPIAPGGPSSDAHAQVLEDHYVDFGEDAYFSAATANRQYDTDTVRLLFTSLTTPKTVYDYDVRTRELTQRKREEVLGGFDPAMYVSERLEVPARDGRRVPVSVVRHRETRLDGSAPLLQYGYGSYGYSMDPTFSSVRLSLLDRGFVWAIAHIRGGEELGRQWYESGKLLAKRNTFNDFEDVGRWLVESDYAAPGKLYAMGGSAGGLLVGAVVNQAPRLYDGVVAQVPFVDVVTTMLDESIPLTTGEYDEWGNPNDETYYRYMLSYSPYDNVAAQDYPNMLVTTGLHDSQVQYWEPAKWVARLRDRKTDSNQLLLHTNMSTGHSGQSGRYERYRETAMEFAWLLTLADVAGG